ncbi:cache domain-containing protein [Aliamphritea spongicola]|uniref:cache domain-containing protein n=1 Tax=Aliamphritea spongicola TaxID=707589 RepID=UPI00196AF993|nr:cache domain-containing protein [Aliamphritea spongicola]MBN3562727.1 cache domain-containing protein [Aliamphritea spongicola]
MNSWHRLRRCPIHLHISTLAVLLVLILGGSLGIYNYHQTRQLINSASGDYLEQLRLNVELEFQRSYAPVAQTVNLLLQTKLTTANNISARLRSLPLLAAALENRPELTALEVGYANGDFFIVRVMNDDHMRDVFSAPRQAVYAVDNIRFARSPRRIQRLFFDENLVPLGPSEYLPTEYDPRKRGWFKLAVDGRGEGKLTDPYLYFFIRKVGVTYTQINTVDAAVIAGDISLDMLAKSVQQQRISPNSHLLILDNQQRVLAYNRSDNLISSATDNEVQLKTLADLQHPLMSQVSHLPDGTDKTFSVSFQGDTWQGQLKTLTPIPEAEFQLLLLTPENDLLAEAYRIRKEGGVIILALLLIALPLTWLMTRRLALPLVDLIEHGREIKRFKFNNSFTDTGIAEVDDLHHVMDEMQHSFDDLFGLLKRTTAYPDSKARAGYVCSELQRLVQCDGVMIYLARDEQNLSLAAGHFPGLRAAQYLETIIPLQLDSLLSRVYLSAETLEGPLSAEDPLVIGGLKAHFNCEMCMLAVPLLNVKGAAVGVMALLAPLDQDTCVEKLSFCEALAGFLGSILLPERSRDKPAVRRRLTSG